MKYCGSKLSEDAFVDRQFKNIMLSVPDSNGVVTINEKKRQPLSIRNPKYCPEISLFQTCGGF